MRTRLGLVDVGSNTIRMNLYAIEGSQFSELLSTKSDAGLISYVHDGALETAGTEKLIGVLAGFQKLAASLDIDRLIVFATQSLRGLSNSLQVIDQVREQLGIEIDLLSGVQEARLSWLGGMEGRIDLEGAYCDIGGGSSELAAFHLDELQQAISLPEGSLSLFNSHISRMLPDHKEVKKIQKHLHQLIRRRICDRQAYQADVLFAAGGSARAVRSLLISLGWIAKEDEFFPASLLEDLISRLEKNPDQSARLLLQLSPSRVHTCFTGLLILQSLAWFVKAKRISVCSHGIREGYLKEKVLEPANEK